MKHNRVQTNKNVPRLRDRMTHYCPYSRPNYWLFRILWKCSHIVFVFWIYVSFVFSQDVGSVKMHNQQVWYDKFLICKLWYKHRYRPEIPEPVPSLFRHGAQIGGIRGFPTIKITMIHQVGMYCGLSVKIDMRETPNKKHTRKDRGHILFAFVSACVVGKNLNTPTWLHGWQHH